MAKSTNAENDTRRSAYWDNMKGGLILLVVFAHCLYQRQGSPKVNLLVDSIYTFHIAAFAFISGYFGRKEDSRSFPAVIRMLFAYFMFSGVLGLIFGTDALFLPDYSCWYLLALVVWRVTAHRLARFKRILPVLFAVALFIGFYPALDNTLVLPQMIAFYPMYMAGYQYSSEKVGEHISAGNGAGSHAAKLPASRNVMKRLALGVIAIVAAAAIGFGISRICYLTDDTLLMYSYPNPIYLLARLGLYMIAALAIFAMRNLCPDRNLPFLTAFGRNSLVIYLFHRPFTVLFDSLFGFGGMILAAGALGCSILICVVFGNDYIGAVVNRYLDAGARIFTGLSEGKKTVMDKLARLSALGLALCFVGLIVVENYDEFKLRELPRETETLTESTEGAGDTESAANAENTAPVLSDVGGEQSEFEGAMRITFAGDLLCLEDQVKRAYTGKGYDFDDVFEYAKPYIESADWAIGVFEGPMAGGAMGYSAGNSNDGKELVLNFPDEFALSVQNAGFDLVTTANEHLLDKGIEGAARTLDVLDEIGLEHTGSYRSRAEKESSHVRLVEKNGIRFAVLSYTYGSCFYDTGELAEGSLSYVTSVISGTEGELFERLKASVKADFDRAKEYNPDFIVVLPHIGTEFSGEVNEEQTVWFELFKEYGADIILGAHSRVIQPVSIEDYNGRKVFVAYCPGNFASVYRENQGDAGALIDVFIDVDAKEIVGGGVVPLYTQSPVDGNYRALPLYEIQNNETLRGQLSTDDYQRANVAHSVITGVTIGRYLDITSVCKRFLFDENGYRRTKNTGLVMTETMRNAPFFTALSQAESVCFVGDSVTAGNINGGWPWFEPIEEYLTADVSNYSKSGSTVSYFTERSDEIPVAELYVIALGTNDVRFRDESFCAMTSKLYVDEISLLRSQLCDKNASAQFIFIAPWYSIDGDKRCPMTFGEKTALNEEYCDALEEFCKKSGDMYINPNPFIKQRLSVAPTTDYLLDHIHPNAGRGIVMYSEAVLSYE